MSWLSEAWRFLKGGRTDAETAFAFLLSRMSSKQKSALRQKLYSVSFAVDIAAMNSNDQRVKEAQAWITGALNMIR